MQYKFKLPGDSVAKLASIRAAGAKQGIFFKGEGSSGNFYGNIPLGRIAGRYQVDGEIMTVSVSEKPTLESWTAVESKLKQLLEG